jgi:hypothetical protein
MNTTKQVQDVYATLATTRPGFPPNETHPFVVYLRYTDGTHSQPTNCRDLRDCLIYGNGMLAALCALGAQYETVNVVFDPRFDH